MQFITNSTDIENVYENMERYKTSIEDMSSNQMSITYRIHEIDTPVTTISHEEEHGYYIDPVNTKDIIYDLVKENEYDHIFVVARMEDETGTYSIPINGNWVGLGGMDMYGIGYSIIRINKNGNTSLYEYTSFHRFPEEVYVHEFLHTLERILEERNYEIPALHDYEKYGYKEDTITGLEDWYIDYMAKNIDTESGEKIGLYSDVYLMKPYHPSDFEYATEIEFNEEPSNIIEEIRAIFRAIKSVLNTNK